MKTKFFQTGFTGFWPRKRGGLGACPQLLILLILLILSKNTVAAPLQWTCDWPEAKSQTFLLYQGETATFEPTFRVNGQVVSNIEIVAVWYTTNGAPSVASGGGWWKLDGNTFAPSNDCGAAAYRFFVEARVTHPLTNHNSQTIYRANGILRMLPSPGFTPNALPLPASVLDFDELDVRNAPWPAEIAAATNALLSSACDYTDKAIGRIPPPDFTTNNAELVATIEATAPAPANYAEVSNAAMSAAAETAAATNELGASLASRVSLASHAATNYTDSATNALAQTLRGETTAATNNLAASLASCVELASRDATNYTDTAISRIVIPDPDFTTGNMQLVATIEATAPAPGDYANVSNRAMSAIQPEGLSAATNELGASLASRVERASRDATNYTDAAVAGCVATDHVGDVVIRGRLAQGNDTTTTDLFTHAEGYKTKASCYCSHAEGCKTTASGYYSHAEGNQTKATGLASHAEGFASTSSGDYSHAEGNGATASGDYSHAEGSVTTASGESSHAEGRFAQTDSSHHYAYAWQGADTTTIYHSHGYGTFNINPMGGIDGFWIGETNFPTHVRNIAATVVPSGGGSAAEKRVAMFILPLNITTNERYTCIELKATTNNFSIGAPHRARAVYYCHTASLELGDGARAYVESFEGSANDQRSYVSVADSEDPDVLATLPRSPSIVILVDVASCRRTDGAWLSDANDELLWTYARGTLAGREEDGSGRAMWRPCSPVRWLSQVPRWAGGGS